MKLSSFKTFKSIFYPIFVGRKYRSVSFFLGLQKSPIFQTTKRNKSNAHAKSVGILIFGCGCLVIPCKQDKFCSTLLAF